MEVKLVKREDVPVRDFGACLTLRILFDKIEGAKSFDLGMAAIPSKSVCTLEILKKKFI